MGGGRNQVDARAVVSGEMWMEEVSTENHKPRGWGEGRRRGRSEAASKTGRAYLRE